jgi:uncharacterized membrane protein
MFVLQNRWPVAGAMVGLVLLLTLGGLRTPTWAFSVLLAIVAGVSATSTA